MTAKSIRYRNRQAYSYNRSKLFCRHLDLQRKPYTEVNRQTWVPIHTNENGYTIVLEYWNYRANYVGAPELGYFQSPRANMIKLVDVSQYTEAYANGRFGGDADGIEDGPDTIVQPVLNARV